MHRTSTTSVSDFMIKLFEFGEKLKESSWMATEELLGTLIAGTLIIDQLTSTTDKDLFTQEEIDFVVDLHDTIGDGLVSLQEEGESNDHDC